MYDNAAEPPHRCGEGSWSTLNVMNEVRRTGSANPVRLSMESCGSAPRSAAGRKKAHSHTQPCAKEKRTAKAGRAQITLRASASGMAKAQEQRIAYLTYPVRAGITVTFSRGLSPHSAASPARPARRPVIQFSLILRHVAANCKREFALRRFFSSFSREKPILSVGLRPFRRSAERKGSRFFEKIFYAVWRWVRW